MKKKLLVTQTNYIYTTLHIVVNIIQIKTGRLELSGLYSTTVTIRKNPLNSLHVLKETSWIDCTHAVL